MNNNWTEEENKILKENYLLLKNKDLVNLLPSRTIEAIKTQKKKLGLRRISKKYTFNDVVNAFEDSKYVLLSTKDDYINSVKPTIRYICPDHEEYGEQKISLSHLLRGQGCPYCGIIKCGMSRRCDLAKREIEYKELCDKHDFIYQNTTRENGKIKIKFICSKHEELGIQEMTPGNMKRDIKGCKYCAGKKLPEWYVLNKAQEINPNIKLLEPYKDLTTRMKCICLEHNKETSKTMQEILKGQGCEECGKDKLSKLHFCDIDNVQERINRKNPHIKLIKYFGISEYAECYCEKHDKYFKKYPSSMILGKSGCSECYTENIRETQGMGIEEFKNRLYLVHPDIEVIGEYVSNNTPIDLYCKKHNYHFKLTPVAALNRCACCEKSRVTYKEEQMCSLLESWGYKVTRQKIFDGCKDDRDLLFDGYLDDFNIAIEYDGEQHFRPVSFGQQTWEDAVLKYEYTIKHDKIKNDYCKKNNIPLIRVPYWEYDTIENYLFDELVKLKAIIED